MDFRSTHESLYQRQGYLYVPTRLTQEAQLAEQASQVTRQQRRAQARQAKKIQKQLAKRFPGVLTPE